MKVINLFLFCIIYSQTHKKVENYVVNDYKKDLLLKLARVTWLNRMQYGAIIHDKNCRFGFKINKL